MHQLLHRFCASSFLHLQCFGFVINLLTFCHLILLVTLLWYFMHFSVPALRRIVLIRGRLCVWECKSPESVENKPQQFLQYFGESFIAKLVPHQHYWPPGSNVFKCNLFLGRSRALGKKRQNPTDLKFCCASVFLKCHFDRKVCGISVYPTMRHFHHFQCVKAFDFVVKQCASCLSFKVFAKQSFHPLRSHFDSTLGYPGEGPWTLASQNVGSLEKHGEILGTSYDAVAFQETRITSTNHLDLTNQARNHSKDLFCGPLMQKMPNGFPTWGGVATLTHSGTARPFVADDDITGHFHTLHATARFHAVWIAVSPNRKMLLVSLYCYTSAQQDTGRQQSNDHLFKILFEMLAQYGDIPIAIAGDFQAPPHAYLAVAAVIRKSLWFDPLMKWDEETEARPCTYCRSCKWNEADSIQSSIDGILLNKVAFSYLVDSEVIRLSSLQHAIIKLTFDWPTCKRLAPTWVPHAAFDLQKIKDINFRTCTAERLWNTKFRALCDASISGDELASIAHQFGIEILLESGAVWTAGSKQRGKMPEAQITDVDKGSNPSNDADSRSLGVLNKTLRRINDLMYKINHPLPTPHCQRISQKLWSKIRPLLEKLECDHLPHWPSHDQLVGFWEIVASHRDIKSKEIRKLRVSKWKACIQKSAASNCHDVFHHLRVKHDMPAHANLCDQNNQPIFHPQEALKFAKTQWDEIFSVDANPIPAQPISTVMADIVGDDFHKCELPQITEQKLFDAVQDRKSGASAGIDGWRTQEVKALPLRAFTPWAKLWNAIESQQMQFPRCLKQARLVMLPKPDAKSAQPIHRRLISLLNIFYLAYSRARFVDTISWQLKTFPKTVVGGIPGRKCTDVSHTIAIACELSHTQKQPVCGIKIDRQKCFDRVVPRIIVALGSILGLDPKFLKTWEQMYDGFQRHLTIGKFLGQEPLANCNGIAQGDTASVLAINILMTCWVKVVQRFTRVSHWVYIDDAYLLAKQEHIQDLKLAMDTTELFDSLTGQKTNLLKSGGWATSPRAKKLMMEFFPSLPLHDWFVVLGSQVKANQKGKSADVVTKAHYLRSLIADIGHLPISLAAKVKILCAKAIPKITFTPELNPWPRLTIQNLTALVVKSLWSNRPMWRSAELFYCVAGNPTRLHPEFASATCVIVNIISRCNTDPQFCKLWTELAAKGVKVISHGLLDAFVKATSLLGLQFSPPFCLQWRDFPSFQFQDHNPKSLRRFLRFVVVQQLFANALNCNRKDLLTKGTNILDIDLLPLGPRNGKPWFLRKWKLDETIAIGPSVGACPTADRLYQAKLCDSPACRFCGFEKETIGHLTSECPVIVSKLGVKPWDSDQPHLASHGLFEVPSWLLNIAKQPPEMSLPTFCIDSDDTTYLWIDGSVYNGNHLFSKALGASIVDQTGSCIFSDGWRELWASSYRAELRALRCATHIVSGSLVVTTDCKSLLSIWNTIISTGEVGFNLSFREEWLAICDKVGLQGTKLHLRWVKAHQFDVNSNKPFSTDQWLNHCADSSAKLAALHNLACTSQQVDAWKWNVYLHRSRLTKLTCLLQQNPVKSGQEQCEEQQAEQDQSSDSLSRHRTLMNRFVRWDWNLSRDQFSWRMNQSSIPKPKGWKFSDISWNETTSFFQGLQWRTGNTGLSVYELAFEFWLQKRFVPPCVSKNTEGMFQCIVDWLRHVLRCLVKTKISICPQSVTWMPRKCLYLSQTYPYGKWHGGRTYIGSEHMIQLATFISNLPNHGSNAAAWKVAISSLP